MSASESLENHPKNLGILFGNFPSFVVMLFKSMSLFLRGYNGTQLVVETEQISSINWILRDDIVATDAHHRCGVMDYQLWCPDATRNMVVRAVLVPKKVFVHFHSETDVTV